MNFKKQTQLIVKSLLAFTLTISWSLAKEVNGDGSTPDQRLVKEMVDPMGPTRTMININNMVLNVRRDGFFPWDGTSTGTAGQYPKGTSGLIFAEGLLWGAKVTDGTDGDVRVRVNGATYASGLKAGKVIHDAGGNVLGAEDPSGRHVWRVRSDYATADLSSDAAYFFVKPLANVSDTDVQSIYDQYEYDWNNWPVADGAPYKEVNGTEGYQPAMWNEPMSMWMDGDIPGYPGASQTVWLVANDVPLIVDETGAVLDTIETASNSYGAPAVGMEIQLTLWAYDFASTHPLGNMLFKKARLTYTGLPDGYNGFDTEIAHIDTMYFTQWSDPDLGTYTDDYVGCDIGLSFGYVYNGNTLDNDFYTTFGLPVPAGGYDFLQGPEVDGAYMPMTSFTYFGAGSSISDPNLGVYDGTLQFFNLMEGFLPRPEYPTQEPWTDPITGETTKFALSGDPATGQGWIDGIQLPPGDRRLVMTTGPFEMSLGETQDVVLALVGGMGLDNISSVTVAKFHDTYAQYAYDNDFQLPSPPSAPSVAATGLNGKIVLNWGHNSSAVSATEDQVIQGFAFEGYNVYQIPSSSSAVTEGKKIATYDLMNLTGTIFDPGVDPTSGFVVDQVKQSGKNTGVQRYYVTDTDELRSRPLVNGLTYYYAISAYSYLADNEGSPFKTLESNPVVVAVTPEPPFPGMEYSAEQGGDVYVAHTGTAGGAVSVSVIDPSVLTGDNYQVYFDLQHYYRDVEGIWNMTNYPDSVGRTLGKTLDCEGSTVTGAALASSNVGTFDLVFTFDMVCPGGAWVDGLVIDLPDDLTINSWAPVVGCDYPQYGQNCENMEGTLDGATNTITWGNDIRSEFGAIQGGQVLIVNCQPAEFPISGSYIVYDDGYDGTIIDGVGPIEITELGYEFKTLKHWNLKNGSNEVLLEDMTVVAGMQIESIVNGVYLLGGAELGLAADPIVDGFLLHVDVGYSAPTSWESVTGTGSGSYDWNSYAENGWAITAYASETFGSGTSSIDLLQRDIQMRFTGVLGDPLTGVGPGGNVNYYPVVEGGSWATIDGARDYDIADHPANPSPGTSAPFAIRIPFEVWDMEADPPEQIDVTIYDRKQAGVMADGGDMYAFNPVDRMYCHIIHRPYNETVADLTGADANLLTWNLVMWETDWVNGDVVDVVYANPIQQGVDVYDFSTVGPSTRTVTDEDIEMINVFPNPYFGFHDLEGSRGAKWMRFNHLPQKATIRVFNLGGNMVRVITKDDATQYADWDLENQNGYPIASGIYIAHIDLPDLGKEKVLRLAVVQEQQVLRNY